MRKVIGVLVGAALLSGCIVTTRANGPVVTQGTGAALYSGYQQVNLQITNATGTTVCYLYISPVSDPNWGPDQLGSRVLSAGETDNYALYAGQWDLRADDCSHNQLVTLRNATIAQSSNLVLQ